MALLLDHGLRVGELVGLQVADVELAAGLLRFYRPKVDKEQTHELTPDAINHAKSLLRGGRHAGKPGRSFDPMTRSMGWPMTRSAGNRPVAVSGELAGGKVSTSCRPTTAATVGPPGGAQGHGGLRLRDAGGWSSLAMPSRYVEQAEIANRGVRL